MAASVNFILKTDLTNRTIHQVRIMHPKFMNYSVEFGCLCLTGIKNILKFLEIFTNIFSMYAFSLNEIQYAFHQDKEYLIQWSNQRLVVITKQYYDYSIHKIAVTV